MKYAHTSVLLKEVIDFLQVKPGEKYIDATLGGGGHSEAILNSGGLLLALDIDEDAIANAKEKFAGNSRIKIVQGNFKEVSEIAHSQNFAEVSGIIFDLGVSSYQINEESRGFSFLKEGPLDMRMDKSLPLKASDLVNLKTKDELYEIFNKFGEERNARVISSNIVRARRVKAILTTEDLSRVVEGSFGFKKRVPDKIRARILKKVFQALRIAVNSELENLELGLVNAITILKVRGRLAVITFHSLEDRIVKEKFLDFEKQGLGQIVTKKPVVPSLAEIQQNRRSRSAKLRVFERV